MKLSYLWAKFFKKIRGSAILNSKIHKTSKIESGCNIINSTFDRHSFCGYDCEIINAEIGAFCSIANNVVIGGGRHPMEWVSTSPVFYSGRDSVKAKFSVHERIAEKKTMIGHDVWIGNNALIKQGVSIGSGSVIGMGSVVTKDIEPYSIVAGCPAKLIRKRFDENTILNLLALEWWHFNDHDLEKFAPYFTIPADFIKAYQR